MLISLRINKVDVLASVGYWTVEGLQKANVVKKRGPEKTGQTPSDGKVSLTGMKFQLFGSQILECS